MIIIVIYLVGVFVSYQAVKAREIRIFNQWTKKDRIIFGSISLFSWFGFAAIEIMNLSDYTWNSSWGNEPAKW